MKYCIIKDSQALLYIMTKLITIDLALSKLGIFFIFFSSSLCANIVHFSSSLL